MGTASGPVPPGHPDHSSLTLWNLLEFPKFSLPLHMLVPTRVASLLPALHPDHEAPTATLRLYSEHGRCSLPHSGDPPGIQLDSKMNQVNFSHVSLLSLKLEVPGAVQDPI